ncbi:ATP-binding protein [Candidatus Micrarchaeota archaeon]|nr:ATP-binding protein [Candidatus Micrarchaeota archaeon]
MQEILFTNIMTMSMKTAEQARVDNLRYSSIEIISQIKSKKGLYIISGLRGVGKTTILSTLLYSIEKSIYLNGDIILKYGVNLLDILHYFEIMGYTTFLIDEIHSIPDWEKDIKIFYDETHSNIVITGSSAVALKTKGSELSRRATIFKLKPLSFREYLYFKVKKGINRIELSDILAPNKLRKIVKQIMPYINEFGIYTQQNALPACFFNDKPDVYINILERIVRYDLQSLREVDVHYIDSVFKVVKFIASSPPGEVSYTRIANSIDRGTKVAQEIVKMLSYSGLLYVIPPEGVGHKAIRSEDKLLMPLSFRSALCKSYGITPSLGGIREDFFIQHVGNAKYLKTGVERRTPDYIIGENIFEIGGEAKRWAQLKNKKNGYLVKETIMFKDNEIPLYVFGLLY